MSRNPGRSEGMGGTESRRMASPRTIAYIRRAKEGDREAWEALCREYYPQWLRAFHGQLGRRLRALHDTADLVQSAIADALRDIKSLRSEAAFYCWVSAIVRRKIADKRRQADGLDALPIEEVREPGEEDPRLEASAMTEEEYMRLLDAILVLFQAHPEPMAAVYLRYFERLDTAALTKIMGRSERSTFRLLETGRALLRARLFGG